MVVYVNKVTHQLPNRIEYVIYNSSEDCSEDNVLQRIFLLLVVI